MGPRFLRRLAVLLGVTGVLALGYAVATGEARVGFLLIFPILLGTGPVAAVGVLLIVGAVVAWFFSVAAAAVPRGDRSWERVDGDPTRREEGKRRAKSGGVILIGPIPIVWGSDKGTALWLVVATLVLIVVVWLLFFRMA